MKTTFHDDSCKIMEGAMIMAHGKKEGTLYMTSGFTISISVASSDVDAGTWRRRLGHMSKKVMKVMLSKGKLPGLKSIDLYFCEDFVYGKQRKGSFSKAKKSPKAERLVLVHTDVWGKTSVPSLSGSLYFVTFIESACRKIWIHFLKQNQICLICSRSGWPKLKMREV